MIIHLEWKPTKLNQKKKVHNLDFDLPAIYFTKTCQISVKQCLIVWENEAPPLYGSIETSLIDKSAFNPTQELMALNQTKKLKYLSYTPMHIHTYIIQRQELQSAEFILNLSENLAFSKIKLTIDISDVTRDQSIASESF